MTQTIDHANIAPVALFVYNRPGHTLATIAALAQNTLADQTRLYIFCDGARNDEDQQAVDEVRELISGIEGFASVTINARDTNQGLAASIIGGVSEVVEKHGRVIVFEDDLVSHPHSLTYFNEMLDRYADNSGVFSISGYNLPSATLEIPADYPYDVYAIPRMQCWGWATWQDRWQKADFDLPDFAAFCASEAAIQGYTYWIGRDSLNTLKACMAGEKDVWACRWAYTHFKHHAVCICPTRSLIDNIGLDNSGMNTEPDARRSGDLSGERPQNWRAPNEAFVDPRIFRRLMQAVDPVGRIMGSDSISSELLASLARKVVHRARHPGGLLGRASRRLRTVAKTLLLRGVRSVEQTFSSPPTIPLVRLGTEYGGWWVPESGLGPDDVVVSAGAGEDISFDVEVANRFGCKVLVLDPTPRAKQHFEETRAAILAGRDAPINDDPNNCYQANAQTFERIEYRNVGLWGRNTTIRFFPNRYEERVSHSIDNLHNTDGGFEAEVITLDELMRRESIEGVTVLKMDIEGAEFAVVDQMLSSVVRPKYLLVEFHAGKSRLERAFRIRTLRYLKRLANAGYRIVQNRDWDYVLELQR